MYFLQIRKLCTMRKLYILCILLSFGFLVKAQDQFQHEKRIYRGEDGRLYVNKDLPIYLRMAVSPEPDAKTYLMESEATKQYANPMYFDTEGKNTFRSPSAVDPETKKTIYPISDVIFEVYADSQSPDTKIQYGDVSKKYVNGKWFFGKGVEIELNSKDALSGVEKVYYSINKENFKEYNSKISLTEEKEYEVQYYAADNVGNAEKTQNRKFTLDTTSPVSSHIINGDQKDNVLSKRSTISLSATDESSGVYAIYYSIDGGRKQVYKGRIYINYLKEGEHTLTYYAVDHVKNEETKKEFVFFLDNTPPIVVEEVMGDQFYINGKAYSSGRTKLKITAVDNKAGVKAIYYSIDGAERQLYDKPFYLPSKSGTVRIKTYAVDNVNNSTGSSAVDQSKIHATYIDLSGPNLNFNYQGPTYTIRDTVYIGKNTKIRLRAHDTESGLKKITYSIDKDGTVDYDKPFPIDSEGFHEISYSGIDNVNNSNIGRLFFVTDLSGPEIIATFSMPSCNKTTIGTTQVDVYHSHAVLFIAAKDQKVGYDRMYYSINGQKELPLKGEIRGFKKGKDYVVKIRAVDKLGNENESIINFVIEE